MRLHLRLYRRAGFVAVGYRRRYYPDKEDARILALAELHRQRVWEPLRERFEVLSALMEAGGWRRRGRWMGRTAAEWD